MSDVNIYKTILKRIQKEVIKENNAVLDCTFHILPDNLDTNVEYIFIVKPDLTDDELLFLRSVVSKIVFNIYTDFNLEYDYINVYSKC